MYIVRKVEEKDFDAIADFEIEISKISFKDKAITDHAFHKKRISSAKDRTGMMVIASACDDVLGWLWMERKQNSLTEEVYINFRSFYIDSSIRGERIVDDLFEQGISFAKKYKAQYIVGKVHAQNIAMRSLYKNHNFVPTHVTMEMELNEDV